MVWSLAKLQEMKSKPGRAELPYASDDEDGLAAGGPGAGATAGAVEGFWELLRSVVSERANQLSPSDLASVLWGLSVARQDPGSQTVVVSCLPRCWGSGSPQAAPGCWLGRPAACL
jgi:hypothetical protein